MPARTGPLSEGQAGWGLRGGLTATMPEMSRPRFLTDNDLNDAIVVGF
jgi:hypothetical protein